MQFYELGATFRMVSTDTARRAVPRRQLSYLLHLMAESQEKQVSAVAN